jgi:hypothetical protein
MAIISPQRSAIVSFESCEEATPLWSRSNIFYVDGQPIHLAGVSKGTNSKKPHVLVFSQEGPILEIEEAEREDCDYAVLLSKPESSEIQKIAEEVGSTALETVELLKNTEDELCLQRTGVVDVYSRIY